MGKSVLNIGFSYCMKNKWVKFDKGTGLVLRLQDSVVDQVAKDLSQLDSLDKSKTALYKKRKMVEMR